MLDDGFQHLQLERDLDLLIVGREDIERPVTLPAGRLREPLDTIIAADAVLTADEDVVIEAGGGDLRVFHIRRTATFEAPAESRTHPVIALAGIADPARFFHDLLAHGWRVADTMTFADHHPYTAKDVQRIFASARRAGAARIMTTEKDFVRLLPFRPFPVPIVYIPFVLEPDPVDRFRHWMMTELQTIRGSARA